MHCLVALDRSARTLHRSEIETRDNPLFDEAMVLLDDVGLVPTGGRYPFR